MARRHFVGLDGIKGLALIAIILYHCEQSWLPGGFYGVDVFLTVSGFLAAISLFTRLKAGEGLGLERYWPRRFDRLYPALVLMIPAVSFAAWCLDKDLLVRIRDQIVTVALGCYNWYAIASGNSYFGQMNPQLLRHLWFVSVLMQLYLVIPIVAWFMHRIRHTHCALLVPLAIAVGSAASMNLMYTPGTDPTRVYFGTDTHAAGFMLGVALAWIVVNRRIAVGDHLPWAVRARRVLAPVVAFIAAIALIDMAIRGDQDADAFQWGIPLASVLSILLIAGTVQTDSWMQSQFVFRPLALLGRYSYGIYLWHWPVWLIVAAMLPRLVPGKGTHLWVLPVTLVITLIATAASWILVERPAARGGISSIIVPGPGCTWRDVVRAVASVIVLLLVVAGGVVAMRDAPGKTSVEIALERQTARLAAEQALGRAQVPTPRKPPHTMPTGDQITAVGDSVMLASAKGMQEVFPGIDLDAAVSRSSFAGFGIVSGKGAGLRQWVVLGLATNGPIPPEQLDQYLNMVGPDRVLVLVNAHGDRTWIPQNNQLLQQFAAAHPDNVIVADWDSAAAANASHLAADGIHPDGGDYYAQAVKQAIQAWIDAGH
ncbi:acyltransferase family protein [Bifidobacterium stellenboschense]|uniref:Acyltransferase n=1 Tax=Bifidobacterium stellenboschense TaxID=762211 RepID=A0A087DZT4_9BIFI|nr:acyltransferase family protein [Bifidobacterium stellenboschense]KFJ01035.1 acyltransferase [Bifidobacterium stellenboschense]